MIKSKKILVSEIFESIDGEGYHAGYPTVFFRVVGCNLRCSWCDSKYTFQSDEKSRWMGVKEAIDNVNIFGLNHITITGGEPLLEENKEWMTEFIRILISSGYQVDVETNGSIDYSYWKETFNIDKFIIIMDWKAPSSKMNKFMLESNLSILDEKDIVKIVVQDDDFSEVEKIIEIGTEACIYISPVFGKVTMEKIPGFVLKHKNKNIRCQIQMHKIFWNPDKRGV